MCKTISALILCTLITLSTRAQVISNFTWNSGTVLQAATGPNASSVGNGQEVTGGSGGTNGLAPNGGNINLVVPGTNFMVPGLDVSIDFLKRENGASFFTIGGLDFGISTGAIYAHFILSKGGVDTSITLNSILAVPADGAFHTYRFIYNNITGVFTASRDGVVGFTYNGIAGRPLSWTGATNVTIGSLMDGGGSTLAELDNLLVQTPLIILPLQLLSFDAHNAGGFNTLDWATSNETDTRSIIVERSEDGSRYQPIAAIAAQQNYSGNNEYHYTDSLPAATSYYRLKMTNTDGSFSYSGVKRLGSASTVAISCYPNPVVDYVKIRVTQAEPTTYQYTLTTLDGKTIQSGMVAINDSNQQWGLAMSAAPKGMIIIRVQDTKTGTATTFKVLKN